jgi:hypothetical protein
MEDRAMMDLNLPGINSNAGVAPLVHTHDHVYDHRQILFTGFANCQGTTAARKPFNPQAGAPLPPKLHRVSQSRG